MDEQIIVADGCRLMRNDKSINDEAAKNEIFVERTPIGQVHRNGPRKKPKSYKNNFWNS